MRSLANSLTAGEMRWGPAPEPEPAPISAFDLSVELLGDLETYKEMLSISLSETHRLTALVERQQATIITLRTEIRDFMGDRRARSIRVPLALRSSGERR